MPSIDQSPLRPKTWIGSTPLVLNSSRTRTRTWRLFDRPERRALVVVREDLGGQPARRGRGPGRRTATCPTPWPQPRPWNVTFEPERDRAGQERRTRDGGGRRRRRRRGRRGRRGSRWRGCRRGCRRRGGAGVGAVAGRRRWAGWRGAVTVRNSFAAANTWSTPYSEATLLPLIALIFRHREPDRNSPSQVDAVVAAVDRLHDGHPRRPRRPAPCARCSSRGRFAG